MNIFYTNKNPKVCAQEHTNSHTVKMILEYAQLLSTAHRVLDGNQIIEQVNNRKLKRWVLSDPMLNNVLYKATHINHPSAVWARQSLSNYMWLSHLLAELCKEYTHRYGKIHKVEQSGLMKLLLDNVPKNISNGKFTEPTPAMPDHYKVIGDSIKSYINYINAAKQHLHKWKNREVPYFIMSNI